jgi:hypothetical protein
VIALVRPGEWNLPLFLHVLGAIALFGSVATVALVSLAAEREPGQTAFGRKLSFVTMFAVVWPSFLAMRVGAQWIYDKEDISGFPGWVAVGAVVGDGGILVMLGLTLLCWLALRGRARAARLVPALAGLYLLALVVAWWAMSAKPGA